MFVAKAESVNVTSHILITVLALCCSCVGQAVSVDEQVDMKASTASLQEEEKPPQPAMTASVSSTVDENTKAQFEEEKLKLYAQLDDKVSC